MLHVSEQELLSIPASVAPAAAAAAMLNTWQASMACCNHAPGARHLRLPCSKPKAATARMRAPLLPPERGLPGPPATPHQGLTEQLLQTKSTLAKTEQAAQGLDQQNAQLADSLGKLEGQLQGTRSQLKQARPAHAPMALPRLARPSRMSACSSRSAASEACCGPRQPRSCLQTPVLASMHSQARARPRCRPAQGLLVPLSAGPQAGPGS